MCLTCGCHLPHENHGKKRSVGPILPAPSRDYLLIEDLETSAAIYGYSLDKALKYLIETVEVAKKEAAHQPN